MALDPIVLHGTQRAFMEHPPSRPLGTREPFGAAHRLRHIASFTSALGLGKSMAMVMVTRVDMGHRGAASLVRQYGPPSPRMY